MTRINSRLSGARKLRLIQSLLQDGIPFGEYKPCHVVIRAGLREFRLGQPNIENPLNSKTCKIFTTQLDKLVNNSQVGAVIVNSVSDEVFSSGMDSHDLKNLKDVNKFAHFIDKTSKVKPIVSVFDGIVANAGYGAFSGSTYKIAGENAKFSLRGLPEGKFPLGGGLGWRIKEYKAALLRYLAITEKPINALGMKKLGLVSHVVPQRSSDSIASALESTFDELIFRPGTIARHVNAWQLKDILDQLAGKPYRPEFKEWHDRLVASGHLDKVTAMDYGFPWVDLDDRSEIVFSRGEARAPPVPIAELSEEQLRRVAVARRVRSLEVRRVLEAASKDLEAAVDRRLLRDKENFLGLVPWLADLPVSEGDVVPPSPARTFEELLALGEQREAQRKRDELLKSAKAKVAGTTGAPVDEPAQPQQQPNQAEAVQEVVDPVAEASSSDEDSDSSSDGSSSDEEVAQISLYEPEPAADGQSGYEGTLEQAVEEMRRQIGERLRREEQQLGRKTAADPASASEKLHQLLLQEEQPPSPLADQSFLAEYRGAVFAFSQPSPAHTLRVLEKIARADHPLNDWAGRTLAQMAAIPSENLQTWYEFSGALENAMSLRDVLELEESLRGRLEDKKPTFVA